MGVPNNILILIIRVLRTISIAPLNSIPAFVAKCIAKQFDKINRDYNTVSITIPSNVQRCCFTLRCLENFPEFVRRSRHNGDESELAKHFGKTVDSSHEKTSASTREGNSFYLPNTWFPSWQIVTLLERILQLFTAKLNVTCRWMLRETQIEL